MSTVARLRAAMAKYRESPSAAVRMGAGLATAVVHGVRTARELATNADARALAWVRLVRGREVHQTTTVTWADRYPEIFARAAAALGDGPDLRILSFGCSTGEEVETLRRYFPTARLTGVEINPRALAACRARRITGDVAFHAPSSPAVRKRGPFEAIFCMAVLQRTPHLVESQGLHSLADLYPFARFDHQVTALDAMLRDGGVLVVHHAQYRVEDATVATRYAALGDAEVLPEATPVFGRDSRRLGPPVRTAAIHVKSGRPA